jgi:hypothetical protein
LSRHEVCQPRRHGGGVGLVVWRLEQVARKDGEPLDVACHCSFVGAAKPAAIGGVEHDRLTAHRQALYAFVIDRLTERPEVADVNTSVVYEYLRNFVIQPLDVS